MKSDDQLRRRLDREKRQRLMHLVPDGQQRCGRHHRCFFQRCRAGKGGQGRVSGQRSSSAFIDILELVSMDKKTIGRRIGDGIITGIEKAGINPDLARRQSEAYATTKGFIASQQTQAAAVGAGSALVPGVYLIGGVIVDTAFLAHKISILTWGIGYRSGCTVDSRDDLATVLSMWCGLLPETDLVRFARDSAVPTAKAGAGYGALWFGARWAEKALPRMAPKLGPKIVAKGHRGDREDTVRLVRGHEDARQDRRQRRARRRRGKRRSAEEPRWAHRREDHRTGGRKGVHRYPAHHRCGHQRRPQRLDPARDCPLRRDLLRREGDP